MKKRALLSVSDKTGLLEFAAGLQELGYEIISTGGTARALQEAGLDVIPVSDVTGFPEIMDGRVKTLHPKIHGGILALRDDPEHVAALKQHDIIPIDLVAVNLYPFAQTIAKPDVSLAEAIENIDIGGPSMVRAAAKNQQHVIIVVKPERYPQVLSALKAEGDLNRAQRLALAQEAFAHTAVYDSMIAEYLDKIVTDRSEPDEDNIGAEIFDMTWVKRQSLRYGENPQQKAAFYADPQISGTCIANAEQLHGKELSYNNILDLNAALELVREFKDEAAVAIIKHSNPCGVALGDDILTAYTRALDCDPVSAFGGIVACNQPVDEAAALKMKEIFLEAIIAPSFSDEALEILRTKKNIRLLAAGSLSEQSSARWEVRTVNGGLLVQEINRELVNEQQIRVMTKEQPTEAQMKDLVFAMTVAKHVKSNAIVLAKNARTIGIGAGQMNRVGSAEIAMRQAGEQAKDAVLASDAFFPFRDTIDAAASAGVKAVIQPGGSIRDEESVQAADEHGIAMIFTGIRHFRH